MKREVLPVTGQLAVSEIRCHHIHELVQGIAARAPRLASMIATEFHRAFEYAIFAGRVYLRRKEEGTLTGWPYLLSLY